MPNYLITYLGGNPPATPEEGQQHFAKYKQWLADLGEAVVSPANPLKGTQTIAPEGSVSEGSQTGMSGYIIMTAESMDAALAMAKSCPFLDIGGSLEVSDLVEMNI